MIQQLPLPLVYPAKPVEDTRSVARRKADKQVEQDKEKLLNHMKETKEKPSDRPNAV